MDMPEHYVFTCPKCGSHALCRIETNLAYRKELDIVKQGRSYLPGGSELMDLEYVGLVGLQCASCRYPDKRRGSFKWKAWTDLEKAGCLTRAPNDGKEPVACMLCAADGTILRTRLYMSRYEELSAQQRKDLLEHFMPGKQGVVICERDPIKDVPG